MRITPRDRLAYRESAEEIVHTTRKMTVLIPTIVADTSTSFDEDTQAGLDSMAGSGTGRTATWTVYELYCFIQRVEQRLMTYGQVPPGVEVGDLAITANLKDQAVLTEAYGNEYHYLYIDGETYRIVHSHIGGIGYVEEATCIGRKFNPAIFRCPGY